jgi:hypothetical protein
MPRKPLAIIFALAVVVGACSLAAPAPSATTGGGAQETPPASAQAAPSASPLPSPASPSAEPSANPPASGSSTGGAQLDCQKLLTAAEAGQALGLADVQFLGDASTLYGNAEWAKNVTICAYGSKSTGLPLILEIWPTAGFDLNKLGSVLGSLPQDVQARDVPGLGVSAKLYTSKDTAALVVGAGSSTLAVVFGRTGGLGGRDTDAVVAIAKLVLPRLPGG